MTEDEARMKWCPFSRVLAQTYTQQGEFKVSTGYNYNRSPDDEEGYITPASMCIGSACMAWRTQTVWHSRAGTIGRENDKPDHVSFCGLAGAPA